MHAWNVSLYFWFGFCPILPSRCTQDAHVTPACIHLSTEVWDQFRSKMGVHDMCSGSPLVLNCMLPPSPKLFYIFLMDFGWLPSDYYLTTINLQPKPSFRSKFRTKISNETFEISFKTTFSFTALRLLLIVRVVWLCGTSQLTPHI